MKLTVGIIIGAAIVITTRRWGLRILGLALSRGDT